jgi:UDP-N-acetylglucosamine--N-acetylmuramyl-(pentapeptide) pyrophosphoryl-undecaprenol N-acetylglucosamine transferase
MSVVNMKSRHLVVVAAGTGGHVMPGLAVADVLMARGWTVSWIGTEHGMENTLVPRHGIALDKLAFAGMRGKGLRHFASGGVRMLAALWASLKLLRARSPAAVFGTGGYVCVPVGLVAAMLRKPLVLLNADAAPLLSNKFLARFARYVAFGFPSKPGALAQRAVWTGNPVREQVTAMAEPAKRYAGRTGPLRLLVVGGSLGAAVLNETIPRALGKLAPELRPMVVHQAGERHANAVRAAYAEAGIEAEVVSFIDDMAAQYNSADLVVCRAGAITVSELCAAGIASLLVPLRVSTTSHQTDNAEFMASAGAALHLPQADLSADRLAHEIAALTRPRLLAMAQAARLLAKPHAAHAVADLIEDAAS